MKKAIKLLIAYLVLLIIYSTFNISSEKVVIPPETVIYEIISADGKRELFRRGEFQGAQNGERMIVKVPLKEENRIEDSVLCFYILSGIVNVWYEEELLYSYGDYAEGRMIGAIYVRSNIPEEAWGHELTVAIDVYEKNAFSPVPLFCVYRAEDSYHYYLEYKLVSFIISAFLLAAAGIGMILFFYLENIKLLRRMVFTTIVYLLNFGLFVLIYSGLYRVFWKGHVWLVLAFVLPSVLPITFLLFLYEFEKERGKKGDIKLIRYLLFFGTASVMAAAVFCCAKIVHYSRFMTYWRVSIIVSMLPVVYVCSRHREKESERVILRGILHLIFWCGLDIVRFFLVKTFHVYRLQGIFFLSPIGIMVFITSFIWGIYKNMAEKHEKEILAKKEIECLELKLKNTYLNGMLSQIQPHFLYNSLSSIRTIIKSDSDRAYDLLYDFTVYLRGTLRLMSDQDMIPFDEELKCINAYLNIEKMRLGGCLEILMNIESRNFCIPPLSIQPLVENAVKHGIFPKGKQGGYIKIESLEKEDGYLVCITDNGVGFEVDNIGDQNDSVGLKNLIYRVKTLTGGTVEISSTPGEGTSVNVKIPKKVEANEDCCSR